MNAERALGVEIILPYRTDWRDMENVLDYCKGKGADRSALEVRFGAGEGLRETLNALEQLSLIERSEAGDVRLTLLGEQLAYAPDRAQRGERLVEAIAGYPPYRAPLERAIADDLAVLDAPWVEHLWQVDMRLGQPRNRVEEARTFFFRLADEAGLGIYRRGVRGQTTRLELAGSAGATLAPFLDRLSSALPQPERSGPVDTTPAPQPQPAEAGLSLDGLAMAVPTTIAPGVSLAIQVDMTEWDMERIERFLTLIRRMNIA
jgi:hypothetical protein